MKTTRARGVAWTILLVSMKLVLMFQAGMYSRWRFCFCVALYFILLSVAIAVLMVHPVYKQISNFIDGYKRPKKRNEKMQRMTTVK